VGKSVILSISSFAPIVLTLVFLSFCPVLLTLKPGEHIHIGKSRIHAFRKVDFKETLDANDCHCEMRKELKNNVAHGDGSHLCFSIAWDWMFTGHTDLGVARELSTSVKAHNVKALFNRNNSDDGVGEQILGKVMFFIISLAKKLILKFNNAEENASLKSKTMELDLLRGIIPVLKWAEGRLYIEENLFLKGKAITEDAHCGLGPFNVDFERYECAICFCELWCYYAVAKQKRKQKQDYVSVCSECFERNEGIFNMKEVQYRRRMNNLSGEQLGDIISTCHTLTGVKKCWWHDEIINQLEKTESKSVEK